MIRKGMIPFIITGEFKWIFHKLCSFINLQNVNKLDKIYNIYYDNI